MESKWVFPGILMIWLGITTSGCQVAREQPAEVPAKEPAAVPSARSKLHRIKSFPEIRERTPASMMGLLPVDRIYIQETYRLLRTLRASDMRIAGIVKSIKNGGSELDALRAAASDARRDYWSVIDEINKDPSFPQVAFASFDFRTEACGQWHDAAFNSILYFWVDGDAENLALGTEGINRAIDECAACLVTLDSTIVAIQGR